MAREEDPAMTEPTSEQVEAVRRDILAIFEKYNRTLTSGGAGIDELVQYVAAHTEGVVRPDYCCVAAKQKQALENIYRRLGEHAAQGKLDSDVWYAITKVLHAQR